MTVLHLAVSLLLSSFTVVIIMLIRKIFSNQLSPKWKYNLWFLLLFALLLPFLPIQLLSFWGTFTWNESQNHIQPSSSTTKNAGSKNSSWIHDFSVSVDRIDWTLWNHVLTIIWITGMLAIIAFIVHTSIQLRK